MSSLEKKYRRNLIVSVLLHAGIIGGIVLVEETSLFGNRTPIPPPAIEADILGDLPKGLGVGRGLYRAPSPVHSSGGVSEPAPVADAAPVNSNSDDTEVPKPVSDEVGIPQKLKPKKPAVEKVAVSAETKSASAVKTTAKNATVSKPKAVGSGTGSSAEDIKNDFAKALHSAEGGTVRGDGKQGGGGNGEGPIGSKNGLANGVVGGVGHGTPNWEYFRHIHDVLYEAWDQPAGGLDKKLVTTINLRIARDGTIENASVRIGSGNKSMDESVLTSVRKVPRLEPPPEALVHGDAASISVNFSLEG